MYKKAALIITTLAIALILSSAGVFAENTEPVAGIGDKTYDTLQDALDAAADGDTVNLLKDVSTADENCVAGKRITLNLSGHTLTGSNLKGTLTITDGGDLTVTGNGTVTSTGRVDVISLEGNGSGKERFTLENGTISSESASYPLLVQGKQGSGGEQCIVTINGGKISGKEYVTIIDSDLVINGGTIQTGDSSEYAVYFRGMPGNSCTITDGTITGGANGLWVDTYPDTTTVPSVKISGGIFTGNTAGVMFTDERSFNTEISGGSFTGGTSAVNFGTSNGNVSITGGRFSGDIIAENLTSFISGGLYSGEGPKADYIQPPNVVLDNTDKETQASYPKMVGLALEPDPTVDSPISLVGAKVVLTKTSFIYNAKVQKPSIKTIGGKKLKANTDYVVKWSNSSSKNAGTYTVTITGTGKYNGTTKATYKINKATNPLNVKAKTVKVKRSKLKKKKQTMAVTKVITFTKKTNDKKTYTLSSAKKGKKSFKKYFKINKTTGKVTIKKNKKMKKGTYKVKVKVKALGNSNYKASVVKTVTFKVKVK